MKNIAIIPARSGSKGLKNKNILPLGDYPLLVWTIKAAISSSLFDKVFVSTDSEEYAKIAQLHGADSLPLRSSELALDTSPTSLLLLDIIKSNKGFDNFCLLQPTSPFRTFTHIKEAYKIFTEKNANSVVSMSKNDKSLNIINTLNSNNRIDNFLKTSSKYYRRQDQNTYYYPNGALFWVKISYYQKYVDFYHHNSYAYIMDKLSSIDIDDSIDFEFCKYLLQSGYKI